jgi:DNA-binding transcriptional LysR family regulator
MSSLSMLPLNALRTFEAASRLGSFKSAAAELGVTPAAVSHQIKALEAQLGLSLFERLHRALRLTQAGERLSAATRTAFGGLEQSLAELRQDGLAAGPASLTLSAASSIAAKWLAARLHRFQALHPRIDLRLRANDSLIDLDRNRGVDVALRYGIGPYDPQLHTVKIWEEVRIVAVCSPALLAGGTLRTPVDLLNHSLLRTAPSSRPAEAKEAMSGSWPIWLHAAGVGASPEPGPFFGSTQLALEAAIAGRGVALSPAVLVEEDLRSGRLVQPFTTSIADPASYWLVCGQERAGEARIRAFIKWVLEEAGRGGVSS